MGGFKEAIGQKKSSNGDFEVSGLWRPDMDSRGERREKRGERRD